MHIRLGNEISIGLVSEHLTAHRHEFGSRLSVQCVTAADYPRPTSHPNGVNGTGTLTTENVGRQHVGTGQSLKRKMRRIEYHEIGLLAQCQSLNLPTRRPRSTTYRLLH